MIPKTCYHAIMPYLNRLTVWQATHKNYAIVIKHWVQFVVINVFKTVKPPNGDRRCLAIYPKVIGREEMSEY